VQGEVSASSRRNSPRCRPNPRRKQVGSLLLLRLLLSRCLPTPPTKQVARRLRLCGREKRRWWGSVARWLTRQPALAQGSMRSKSGGWRTPQRPIVDA